MGFFLKKSRILAFKIYLVDYPHVGLLHGNNLDDSGFTVLLPNGAACTDHSIPDLPFFSPQSEDQPQRHGMVEIDGILYMGGGELDSGLNPG